MKKFAYIAVYISTSLLFLGIGFIIGRANLPTPINKIVDEVINEPEEAIVTSASQDTVPEKGIVVGDSLSVEQKAMLKSFGIDPDTFVLTPEMIVCAENKLGAVRMTEIQNGATPTFLEGASLISCYQ
jgi:hypothetical protein